MSNSSKSDAIVNQNPSASRARDLCNRRSDLRNISDLLRDQLKQLYTASPRNEMGIARVTQQLRRFIEEHATAIAASRGQDTQPDDAPPPMPHEYSRIINEFYWVHRELAEHLHDWAARWGLSDFRPRRLPAIVCCPECVREWFYDVKNWDDYEAYLQWPHSPLECPTCAECDNQRIIAIWPRSPATDEVKRLRSLPYAQYLKSDHWERIRTVARERAGGRCQLCNNDANTLDTHHRTYENLGQEQLGDVIVLCRPCHEKHHDIESEVKRG